MRCGLLCGLWLNIRVILICSRKYLDDIGGGGLLGGLGVQRKHLIMCRLFLRGHRLKAGVTVRRSRFGVLFSVGAVDNLSSRTYNAEDAAYKAVVEPIGNPLLRVVLPYAFAVVNGANYRVNRVGNDFLQALTAEIGKRTECCHTLWSLCNLADNLFNNIIGKTAAV